MKHPMIRHLPLFSFLITVLFSSTSQAQVSLLGGRIGTQDAPALAEFYKNVFGMHEVNRFVFPDGGIEVMLNFGDSAAAASANTGPQIVLMPRESDAIEDTMAHLIFNVVDIQSRIAAIEAAGGQMTTEELITIEAADGQILIAIAKDPSGNLLEMIQQPY